MTIRAELDVALETAPRLERDGALVELARHYADLLDDLFDRLAQAVEDEEGQNFARASLAIARIGARLEATLDRLGMSPGARPVIPRGDESGGDPASAALDALRGGAGAPAPGVDPTAFVDPAVAEADTGD